MKHKTVLKTALIICMGLILTVQAQDLKKSFDHWTLEYDKVFKVKAGGTLKLSEIRGDVSVTPGKANEVQIHVKHKIDVETKDEAEAIISTAKGG